MLTVILLTDVVFPEGVELLQGYLAGCSFTSVTGIDDVVALGSRFHTEVDFFSKSGFFFQQRSDHNLGPSVPISFRIHENHQRTPSKSSWRLEVLEKAHFEIYTENIDKYKDLPL